MNDFESGYSASRPAALGVAVRILRNHADAEDCLQQASLLAWTHFPGFRGDGSFQGWFAKIVRNVPQQIGSNAPSPEDQFAAVEARQAMELELRRLPEPQRRAVLLRMDQDGRLDELAEAEALPVTAFKGRLHRGASGLRSRVLRRQG